MSADLRGKVELLTTAFMSRFQFILNKMTTGIESGARIKHLNFLMVFTKIYIY